ncbi:MAG: MFS transporter [Pseudomonadota bacterium]
MSTTTGKHKNPIIAALVSAWALLVGMGLLMLGNGLQGSLLGLRAGLEGFGSALTGILMACFFAGFLVGSVLTSRIVRRVGHIRTFAALVSVASVAILVHAVFIEPVVWGLMRLTTGICFAGIFVVAESWLNARADNHTRGQMLSIYMLFSFGGMAGGQLMLNLADPSGTHLFIMVSVVISVAVLPILLSNTAAPTPEGPQSIGLRRLYTVSPLGVVGTFAAGTVNGTLFGMGAVYAGAIGLEVSDIALFMMATILGAVALQWPIGKISDLIDRRIVLTSVTFLAALAALLAAVLTPTNATQGQSGDLILFLLATALFGGLSLSLHPLSLAYTNDYLEPTELVGASGGLVLILGAGSIIGPLAVGTLIAVTGPDGFFYWLLSIHAAVGLFALWRMTQRAAVPNAEQGSYVAVAVAPSAEVVIAAEEVHAEGADRPDETPEMSGDDSDGGSQSSTPSSSGT